MTSVNNEVKNTITTQGMSTGTVIMEGTKNFIIAVAIVFFISFDGSSYDVLIITDLSVVLKTKPMTPVAMHMMKSD